MAYESELELEDEFEEELEDELEDEGFLGDILGEGEDFLGDILGESESEYEYEDEYEDETSPVEKIYPDALMEHLGTLAAESESEDQAAEQFLPLVGMAASKLLPVVAKAVAPMAKRALPKIAKVLTKATPKLTQGIGKVAKVLHRNPQTRHLVVTVPSIARRTVGSLAHKAARGGHITPHTAVRTLAKQTRRVLGTPLHRAKALSHHNHLERKFHQGVGRGIAHPHMHLGQLHGWRWGAHGGIAPRSGVTWSGGVHRPGVRTRAIASRPVRFGRTVGGRVVGGHGGHCGCCCGCCGR